MRYFEVLKNNQKSFDINGYNNTFNIYIMDEKCNENSEWLKEQSYYNLSLKECLEIKRQLLEQNYKPNIKTSFFGKLHRLLCEDAETNQDIHVSLDKYLLDEFADPDLNNFVSQYVKTDTGLYNLNVNYKVIDGVKTLNIVIEKNTRKQQFVFDPNLPKFGWLTLDSLEEVKRFCFDLKMMHGQTYKIIIDTNLLEFMGIFETTLPGHMGMDLVVDTSINPTEILAQYQDTDYDLKRTLGKLETSNPSWRFIIDQRGYDEALKLLKKIIKKN